MRPALRPALLAVIALAAAGSVSAGDRTYRWTDEKGRVHYSDVKTEKGQQVDVKPGSRITGVAQDSPATLAARQLDCQRKKDQVSVYNSSSQINETDSLGKTRTYSDEERQQLIQRAQTAADVACSQPGAATPLPAPNAAAAR